MRRVGLGFAAAMFFATLMSASFAVADSPSIDPDAQKLGMKEAPAVVQAAQLPCTVSDAVYLGAAGAAKYYEVACKEGLGFTVGSDGKAAPDVRDCVMNATPGADGKPNSLACKLPENRANKAPLQSYATAGGADCAVDKERYVGSSDTQNFYEVSCSGSGGYILTVARSYAGAPKATDCTEFDPASGVKCTLISSSEQFAKLDKLAAASGKPCTIKDRRTVGATPNGDSYYEFACTDGSGFMVKTDASGKFARAIDCGDAGGIGNGCTLSDAQQATLKAAARYSGLAKSAGFNCNVNNFVTFQSRDPNVAEVELACSNREDGGVGIFPATGSGHVLNCLRASVEGFACSLTPTAPLYAGITAALKSKGKNGCVVSNARGLGVGTTDDGGHSDLIEVACADGGPGLVLEYGGASDVPTDILNCVQAKSLGGCKLPRQKVG